MSKIGSVEAFRKFYEAHGARAKGIRPLHNVTFFVGAGFSKAWDKKFPAGDELFTLDNDFWSAYEAVFSYVASNGFSHLVNAQLTSKDVKEIVYSLGMQKKYADIRSRYFDEPKFNYVLDEFKLMIRKNFERHIHLNYWNKRSEKFSIERPDSTKRSIVKFFGKLFEEQDGSEGYTQGIRTNFISTNYDFLIEAIFDTVLGKDDSILLYQYRGISPRRMNGNIDGRGMQIHSLNSNLFKINGGFEIFRNGSEYSLDYRKLKEEDIVARNQTIMLPSKEQDYEEPYFKAMFPKCVRLLHESTVLVIVGYSLPEEDSLLRFLLKQFAEDEDDVTRKVVFYVDMCDVKEQINRIQKVFPDAGEPKGINFFPYSGTFGEWIEEIGWK